jgi:hypothetical protein
MTCWGGFSPASASASNPQPGQTKAAPSGAAFFCLKFVAGDDHSQVNSAPVGAGMLAKTPVQPLDLCGWIDAFAFFFIHNLKTALRSPVENPSSAQLISGLFS